MRDVDFMAAYEGVMKQIKEGAFLTVKAGEALNTMTIGWATLGFAWRKPVMMVMVRNSRHTFSLIREGSRLHRQRPYRRHEKRDRFLRDEVRPGRRQVQGVPTENRSEPTGRFADRPGSPGFTSSASLYTRTRSTRPV